MLLSVEHVAPNSAQLLCTSYRYSKQKQSTMVIEFAVLLGAIALTFNMSKPGEKTRKRRKEA
jgi:hypothetical protein